MHPLPSFAKEESSKGVLPNFASSFKKDSKLAQPGTPFSDMLWRSLQESRSLNSTSSSPWAFHKGGQMPEQSFSYSIQAKTKGSGRDMAQSAPNNGDKGSSHDWSFVNGPSKMSQYSAQAAELAQQARDGRAAQNAQNEAQIKNELASDQRKAYDLKEKQLRQQSWKAQKAGANDVEHQAQNQLAKIDKNINHLEKIINKIEKGEISLAEAAQDLTKLINSLEQMLSALTSDASSKAFSGREQREMFQELLQRSAKLFDRFEKMLDAQKNHLSLSKQATEAMDFAKNAGSAKESSAPEGLQELLAKLQKEIDSLQKVLSEAKKNWENLVKERILIGEDGRKNSLNGKVLEGDKALSQRIAEALRAHEGQDRSGKQASAIDARFAKGDSAQGKEGGAKDAAKEATLGQRLWDKVVLTKENTDSFGHNRRQDSESQWRQGNFLRNLQSFQEKSSESVRNLQHSTQTLSQKDIQTAINEILQRAKMVQQSKSQFRFSAQLKPEWLGQMRFHIEYDRGQMIGKFFVESESAKEALQQNLQYLKKEFNNMGLDVAEFEVAQEQFERSKEFGQNGEADEEQTQGSANYNGKEQSEDELNAEGELSDTVAGDRGWRFDLHA